MATEHLPVPTSLYDLFHEPDLCQDEILTILQTLDDNNNNNIFNVAVSTSPTHGRLTDDKNSTTTSNNNKNKRRRKKPVAKTASSSSPGFGSDEEYSDDDHAVLSQRKCVKRQKDSRPATSTDDVSGEDGGGSGKGVSHIAVERNRRKQMNKHLAVLRQLMPCFYVKKGDQASIIGGVIDYINELQQVLQSLEAKKQRKIYTSDEVGQSSRIASSPRLLIPQQLSNPSPISPRKAPPSPGPLITIPISPSTPQSTSPYKPQIRQPLIKPSSITSPTLNSNSPACSSFADMILMMNHSHNSYNYNGVANELVVSSKSNVADVQVKFCGPNLELKTLSSKFTGQTLKMVSVIEDLSLEILQVSINILEQTMLNTFIIKIGIECQLSAEELAQQIQQTFC